MAHVRNNLSPRKSTLRAMVTHQQSALTKESDRIEKDSKTVAAAVLNFISFGLYLQAAKEKREDLQFVHSLYTVLQTKINSSTDEKKAAVIPLLDDEATRHWN